MIMWLICQSKNKFAGQNWKGDKIVTNQIRIDKLSEPSWKKNRKGQLLETSCKHPANILQMYNKKKKSKTKQKNNLLDFIRHKQNHVFFFLEETTT